MKKITLLMALLMLVYAFAGCRIVQTPKCTHDIPADELCSRGKVCSDCRNIIETHKWKDATCTTPKKCSACGETKGSPIEHDWEAATCSIPKTCTVCDTTSGQPEGHTWDSATCYTPKTCNVCGETQGNPAQHQYVDGYCEWCYDRDPFYLDPKSNDILTIEKLNWDVNSVGGVEVDIEFKNRSDKQIAYVYFTLKFYDRMGNPAYCEIKNTHTQRLQYTGPINAGARKTGYWDPIIYCSSTAVIKPKTIDIEYTDGTKVTITCTGRYWYSGDFYGGSLND